MCEKYLKLGLMIIYTPYIIKRYNCSVLNEKKCITFTLGEKFSQKLEDFRMVFEGMKRDNALLLSIRLGSFRLRQHPPPSVLFVLCS